MSGDPVRELKSARDLLARLAVELGHDCSVAESANCGSLELICASFRLPRHALRLVELSASSSAGLVLPALVVIDGALGRIADIGHHSARVEFGDGSQRELPWHDLTQEAGGVALEAFPMLSRHGGFLARLSRLFVGVWRDVTKLGTLALACTGLALVPPVLTRVAIDRALGERAPNLLTLLALGTLMVSVQRALLAWLEQRASLALQVRVEAAVATRMFDHLLRIPYVSLARGSVGSWLQTLASAQQLQQLSTETLLLPAMHFLTASVYLAALAWYSAATALVLCAAAVALVVVSLVCALYAAQLQRAANAASARQEGTLFEVLTGVATLRAAGAQGYGVMRWLDRLLEARSVDVRLDRLRQVARAVVRGLREFVRVATFAMLAYMCSEELLGVGELLSLSMLADGFMSASVELSEVFFPLITARPHLARCNELLSQPDVTRNSTDSAPAAGGQPVVMENVWFRYGPDQPWVLRDFSLRISADTHYDLRGASGMGKTTILRLIAGLYSPERGSVRVFGRLPSAARDHICYLPQDSRLFQGSIRQNLQLLANVPFARVLEAAEQSGLAAFIAALPMGYETVLPAGGGSLSGGQRQLIMWTAAMASGRPLLLMDEALSQVDRITRVRAFAMARGAARTVVSVEHELPADLGRPPATTWRMPRVSRTPATA